MSKRLYTAAQEAMGRAGLPKSSEDGEEDLFGEAESSIESSVLTQAPFTTEAGESTQEGGFKDYVENVSHLRTRNRPPTNFFRPDPRPDIVIVREIEILRSRSAHAMPPQDKVNPRISRKRQRAMDDDRNSSARLTAHLYQSDSSSIVDESALSTVVDRANVNRSRSRKSHGTQVTRNRVETTQQLNASMGRNGFENRVRTTQQRTSWLKDSQQKVILEDDVTVYKVRTKKLTLRTRRDEDSDEAWDYAYENESSVDEGEYETKQQRVNSGDELSEEEWVDDEMPVGLRKILQRSKSIEDIMDNKSKSGRNRDIRRWSRTTKHHIMRSSCSDDESEWTDHGGNEVDEKGQQTISRNKHQRLGFSSNVPGKGELDTFPEILSKQKTKQTAGALTWGRNSTKQQQLPKSRGKARESHSVSARGMHTKRKTQERSDVEAIPEVGKKSKAKLKKLKEMESGTIEMAESLDDLSDAAHRVAQIRLQHVGANEALKFCQQCLQDTYNLASLAVTDLVRDDSLVNKQNLENHRISIVGLWCVYARLLFSISETIPSDTEDSSGHGQLCFEHLGVDQLLELRLLLLEFSLVLLEHAAFCPFVGGHPWIALLYSKIAQVFIGSQCYDKPTIDKLILLETAARLCKHTLGLDDIAGPCYEALCVDRLVQLRVVDQSVTLALLQVTKNKVDVDASIFRNAWSSSVVKSEIEKLEYLERKNAYANIGQRNLRNSSADPLLLLPLPATTKVLNFTSSRDDDSVLEDDFLQSEEEYDAKYLARNRRSRSSKIFGLDVVDDKGLTESTRCRRSERGDIKLLVANESLRLNKSMIAVSTGVGHQWSYSPSSKECPNQLQIIQIGSNDAQSTETQALAEIEKPAMTFGGSKLKGDWVRMCFDPENGPHLRPDELLEVLDYSVEFVQVDKQDLLRTDRYSLTSPYIAGQLGLRCQHCRSTDHTATVFPESVESIAQAMWYLSLTHLDQCSNQPHCVRRWHEEFRKKVRLDSFLPRDYWVHIATEANIGNIPGGGLIPTKWSFKKKAKYSKRK